MLLLTQSTKESAFDKPNNIEFNLCEIKLNINNSTTVIHDVQYFWFQQYFSVIDFRIHQSAGPTDNMELRKPSNAGRSGHKLIESKAQPLVDMNTPEERGQALVNLKAIYFADSAWQGSMEGNYPLVTYFLFNFRRGNLSSIGTCVLNVLVQKNKPQ